MINLETKISLMILRIEHMKYS